MIPTELGQIISGFLLALAGWLVRHYLGGAKTPAPPGTAAVLQQLQRDAATAHELRLIQDALNARLKQE